MKVKIILELTQKEARKFLLEMQEIEDAYDDGRGGHSVKFPMLHQLENAVKYPSHGK